MTSALSYPYVQTRTAFGEFVWRPYLPILLRNGAFQKHATALVDSGSDVNLLPYQLGIELGATWHAQHNSFTLSGALAGQEARGILVEGKVENYQEITLAFAWAETDDLPLILGQTNFFQQFDLCFHNTNGYFTLDLTGGSRSAR